MIEATRLEGRSRVGAVEDRGRGNSQPATADSDSTQLRSSSSRSFSLWHPFSVSHQRTVCIGVSAHDSNLSVHSSHTPTHVYRVVSFDSEKRTTRRPVM